MAKRVHILTAVNAANVSKSGTTYTIKDVCGCVDDLVMNSRMYPADQLAAGYKSLEGKPAPAGHPKNSAGQHISALNGEALSSAWMGSYCRNARHEGGRTLVDVVVNAKQAAASEHGSVLIERLDAAIAGTNAEPIHVSTGLMLNEVKASGESRGKKYTSIATNLQYDHLAILLNEQGAATPEEGVGLFLNSEGEEPEQVENVSLSVDPEDRRSVGLMAWIKRLVGNASVDASFDAITSGLYALMPEGAWLRDVFDSYCIWSDSEGRLFKQDYTVSSETASVAFAGHAIEVTRKVSYDAISTNSTEVDPMKDKILAALNAAGIASAGLDETQLLAAYNSLITKPVTESLNAANDKLVVLELAANAAADAEATILATALAVNTSLSVDDLKKLGLPRLKELDAARKTAAPVVAATNGAAGADEFAGYSLNAETA